MRNLFILCSLIIQASFPFVSAFTSRSLLGGVSAVTQRVTPTALAVASESSSAASKAESVDDDSDLVAKRLVVTGDVQGGYVRACVINEAGRFRRLVGTMTDPDVSSDRAEIYVEGKRAMVDGFVRWCQRGKVGLSQTLRVQEVIDEEPTGLYESFYCKTK